jgi:hypothetical protein
MDTLVLPEPVFWGAIMAKQLPCTFLLKGDRYDLIGVAGSDVKNPDRFSASLEELPTASHATYEIVSDALYLAALTLREGNVQYLPFGRMRLSDKTSPIRQQALRTVAPFTGKIRLARNFINEPDISFKYRKALGFEFVIDMQLKNGRVLETKDRSLEMEQKRDALKKYRQSPAKLEKIRGCKVGTFKTELHTVQQD